jgi:hypothetical protein
MKTLKACKLFFAGISFIFSHTLYGQISGTPYIFDKQPMLTVYLKADSWSTVSINETCHVWGVCYNAYNQSLGSDPLGHIDTSGEFVFDIGGRYLVEAEHRDTHQYPNWGHGSAINLYSSRIWAGDAGLVITINPGDKAYNYYCGQNNVTWRGSTAPLIDNTCFLVLRYLGQ